MFIQKFESEDWLDNPSSCRKPGGIRLSVQIILSRRDDGEPLFGVHIVGFPYAYEERVRIIETTKVEIQRQLESPMGLKAWLMSLPPAIASIMNAYPLQGKISAFLMRPAQTLLFMHERLQETRQRLADGQSVEQVVRWYEHKHREDFNEALVTEAYVRSSEPALSPATIPA